MGGGGKGVISLDFFKGRSKPGEHIALLIFFFFSPQDILLSMLHTWFFFCLFDSLKAPYL